MFVLLINSVSFSFRNFETVLWGPQIFVTVGMSLWINLFSKKFHSILTLSWSLFCLIYKYTLHLLCLMINVFSFFYFQVICVFIFKVNLLLMEESWVFLLVHSDTLCHLIEIQINCNTYSIHILCNFWYGRVSSTILQVILSLSHVIFFLSTSLLFCEHID